MRLKAYILAAALLACSLLSACGVREKYEHQQYVYLDVFDTISYVDVYLEDGEKSSEYEEEIHEELLRYHRMFDAYNSYEGVNNVYTVNSQAGKAPVKVDEELFDLVKFSLDNMEKTEYRTNIVLGSVTGIWKQFMNDAAEKQQESEIALPSKEELEQAAEHTDWTKVVLDEENQTIFLEDPEMILDVGAVAKGYTAQRLADYIRSLGIESASINMGGNIKFVGERKAGDGRSYWIGSIQDPQTMQASGMGIKLEDGGTIVTSGNYERYVMVDGVRYCHLIDPDTLQPAQQMASVSIIAEDSGLADYLSTALFTVDVETGKEILSHYDGVEAYWITADYETYSTDGFEKLLVK
ncbi:MAG: FAD:protein FMN transferase [Lachnospiraceae bacterium]|nr:FAD:protein FMN transferase [Lachnospiraceae bacterium]